MNKPLKYTSIGLGAVFAALIAAVAVFVATFDPNHYKAEAAQAVQRATGRELAIPGDLKLELFPWLALSTGRVELGNAAGFEGPFASFEGFAARVRVAPLLRGEIQIGAVTLRGVSVALAVDAKGRNNWSDLAGGSSAAAEGVAAAPGGGENPTPREPLRFKVDGVTIDDATFSYRDARDGSTATLSKAHIATTSIAPGDPAEFEGTAEFSSSAPALSGTLRFKFTRAADATITGFELGLDAKGAALPAPLKDAKLTIVRLTPGDSLTLAGLHFAAWGLALDGDLALAAGTPGKLTGHIESAPFAPREVLPALGIAVPKTADAKALATMAFAFDLEQQGDKLALDRFKLSVDGSSLSGRIALDSIAKKALRFDLTLDALDADRYLPPPATAETPAASGGLEAVPIAADWLRGLDLAGTLRAGKLAVAKVDVSDLRVALSARDGRLSLKPFGAALYGGKVQGEAELDARAATPAVHLKVALAGVKIHELLADAFDSKLVSGKAKLDLDLNGAGKTVGELKHALDGTVQFEVDEGVIEGFNVWKTVRLGWAKLKGRDSPAASDPDRTAFEQLSGGATLIDGVATLEGVRAAIQFAEVTAKGQIDLGASRLKVEAKAKINQAPEFGPNEKLTDLKGVTLPVTLSGSFAKPAVSVDMTKAATSSLLNNDKLKKKLKGLF